MTKYLYGASVQGIQDFIFETNKLKEIVGASEIVEQLCGSAFDKFLKGYGITLNNDNYIIKAAGNIRLISDKKEVIECIVKYWGKKVEELAPGVTLSQAVVKVDGELTKKEMNSLEQKLKTQRNKGVIPTELASMAVIRSRRTGKPAVDWSDGKGTNSPRNVGSKKKQSAGSNSDGAPRSLIEKCIPNGAPKGVKHHPFNIEDIVECQDSSWLAVIHADGNSLGKIIQGMSQQLTTGGGNLKEAYSEFSRTLDLSTTNAAKKAVGLVCLKEGVPQNIRGKKADKYPFRPVVVGGDDLTIIIRADLALEFTEVFLKAFEEETKNNMAKLVKEFNLHDFEHGLTACAGIAFMKSSYPFHYAVELAEQLCGDAKLASKQFDHTPSSISFHKIQDSFVESYQECIQRELNPNPELSFKYGPYGFDPELPSVSTLKAQVNTILEQDAPKSGIRQWLNMLYHDSNKAGLWLERVKEVTTEYYCKKLKLDDTIGSDKKTHLYDVMTLATLMKPETIAIQEGE